MKLLLIAAAVGLTACASSGDLRQNQPDQVLTSAKPARSASACIHERLEDMISMSKINSRVTETGYTVSVYDMGFVRNAIYTIDSQDNPSGGSTMRIYKGFIVGGKVIEIVKACM